MRGNNGTAEPVAGENSAAGVEEDISHPINSPWNDATALSRAQPQAHSDPAKTTSVESLAASPGAAVAPALERAAPDSPGKPANTSGGLNGTHFLGNIVRQASLLTRPDGASQLTLNLQPPELGTVVVRLTLKDNHLQGQLQVDSQSVREDLQSLIPAVKQSLAGEGINLDRLDVGVRGQGGQAAGQDSSGGRQASRARSFSPRDGHPRSESGTREEKGVSGVTAVLSRQGWTSPWVGVMDFVA